MIRVVAIFAALVCSLGAIGCDVRDRAKQARSGKPGPKAASPSVVERNLTTATGKADRANSAVRRHPQHEKTESWLPPLRVPGGQTIGEAPAPAWTAGVPFTETQALERIERELKDALKVRPTLVVWLFDQSAAAGPTRRAVAAAAVQMHGRLSSGASAPGAAANTQPQNEFSTAMIAYGRDVNVLTPEPVTDASQLPAPDALGETPAASMQAFAAVKAAATRFAPFRLQGREVILVLVAHSASADKSAYESAITTLSRMAIPVFGIGPAAPFGRVADALSAANHSAEPALSFESRYPERIQLFLADNQGDAELSDAGYGPFHLERLCRATDGHFLRIRLGGSPGWATSDDGEVNRDLLRKYAPDYVSDEEYQALLADNRACRALHEAAKLPAARVLIAPAFDFPKEDEAALARALSMAQRAPAENQPALEKLHETLAAGEADRPKLTRPRWQAGFDLAFGRACAARARNEGYNHMLAVLKNGKSFANPGSTTWSLKSAEGIAGRSDLDKMARNAKVYLERVASEHPGTPWAALAARELQTPCGWEWTER